MVKLLIIADDFTGALDTGVQFAAYGAATRVETDPLYEFSESAASDTEVLVLNAETRHLSPEKAYSIVFHAVRAAKQAGIPYIYKKTDSALRGNIGSELTAAMDATGEKRMIFVPAFPQMGRITHGGNHYIDGKPVAESVFGRDPFEPVKSSSVRSIIAKQTDIPVVLHREGEVQVSQQHTGIHVYDAESDETLHEIASGLGTSGLHLSAGCAGFAAVLARLLALGGTPPQVPPLIPALFVVCGSINPFTQLQLKQAEQSGFLRIRLSLLQKMDPMWMQSEHCGVTVNRWLSLAKRERCCILDSNDPEGSHETMHYANLNGLSNEDVRVRISTALGKLSKRLLDGGLNATLLCTGGDTLLALMKATEVSNLTPICELASGVVLSDFEYDGKVIHIISKSGGFGAPDLLSSLAREIGAKKSKGEPVC